jgi:hypothetical protein
LAKYLDTQVDILEQVYNLADSLLHDQVDISLVRTHHLNYDDGVEDMLVVVVYNRDICQSVPSQSRTVVHDSPANILIWKCMHLDMATNGSRDKHHSYVLRSDVQRLRHGNQANSLFSIHNQLDNVPIHKYCQLESDVVGMAVMELRLSANTTVGISKKFRLVHIYTH